MKLSMIALLAITPVLSFATAFPKIQHWNVNKTPVYFVQNSRLPFVIIQTSFRAGSAYDQSTKGLALLTGSLLDQGAGGMSANQLADQFSSVGAHLNIDVNRDKATVGLKALTTDSNFTTAFQAYLATLSKPDFPGVAFRRVKAQQLQSLQFAQQYPSAVASKTFYAALYGNTPYGASVSGTISGVKGIQLPQVKQFYQTYYVANNAVITIVGDVSKHNAEYISSDIVENLNAGQLADLPYANQAIESSPKSLQKHMPVKQTTVLIGLPALAVGDSRYYAAVVGNRILGGGQNSLLYQRVRSDNGLVYAVSSGFQTMLNKAPFLIRAQTENQDASKTIALIGAVVGSFLANGPTEKELTAAKDYILGSYQMAFDSNAATAGLLTRMAFYGLPLDYFKQYPHHIRQVTAADVKKVMKEVVDLSQMVTVQVGGA